MARLKPGRPALWKLSGLMLPDFPLLLNMDGLSLNGIAKETGMESLIKRAEMLTRDPEVQDGGWVQEPAVEKKVRSIFAVIRGHGLLKGLPDYDSDLTAAMDGDQDARDRLDAMGTWQLSERMYSTDCWMKASAVHCAEVERASQRAIQLLQDKDYGGLADEIAANVTLRTYFTPVAVDEMRRVVSDEQALVVRAAGLCEFLLAQVARLACLTINYRNDESLRESYQRFLKPGQDGRVNPGRAFFQCFKEAVGAKSIGHILALAAMHSTKQDGPLPNDTTLKRWSCGQSFPSEKAFRGLLRQLACVWNDRELLSDRSKRIVAQYCVARRLDALLDLVQSLTGKRLQANVPHPFMSLLGATKVDEWIIIGYEKWLAHWSEPAKGRLK